MCYGIKSKCKTNSRACELVVSPHFIPHSVACSQHPCFRTVSRLFSRVFSLCLTQLPLLHSIKLDTWTLTSDSSLFPPLSFKQLWLWNTGDKGIRRDSGDPSIMSEAEPSWVTMSGQSLQVTQGDSQFSLTFIDPGPDSSLFLLS